MKKISLLSALAAMSICGVAQAKSMSAKILKVNSTATRVIVSTIDTDSVSKGDFLAAGTNCEMEVVSKRDTKLILDAGLCEDRSKLKKGKRIKLVDESKFEETTTKSSADFDPYASNNSRTEYKKIDRPRNYSGAIARGFRVTIAKPDLDAKEKTKFAGESASTKDDAEAKLQFGIGFADIGANRAGYIFSINHTDFDSDEDKMKALRIEGSGAMGFNQNVYGFAGLNINDLSNSGADIFDLGVGYQLGLGVQATEQIGLDIKLVSTNNKGEIFETEFLNDIVDVEVELTGIELGVHATF